MSTTKKNLVFIVVGVNEGENQEEIPKVLGAFTNREASKKCQEYYDYTYTKFYVFSCEPKDTFSPTRKSGTRH